jgi:hypothetical protein
VSISAAFDAVTVSAIKAPQMMVAVRMIHPIQKGGQYKPKI